MYREGQQGLKHGNREEGRRQKEKRNANVKLS